MKTRAKFYCHAVNKSTYSTEWHMSVVYHNDDPSHENSKFNEASPNGEFRMSVDNDIYKGEHPEPGKEYYLDISLAE